MAIASWLNLSPTSGSAGTTQLSVGGTVHTGRSSRTITPTAKTTAGSPEVTVELPVTQEAAGNILTIIAPSTVAKTGASLVINGTSNAPSLAFQLGLGSAGVSGFTLSTLQISTDGGSTWKAITNTGTISGDPGAAATYLWRATVVVAANTTVSARSCDFCVYNFASYPTPIPNPSPAPSPIFGSVLINQAAGDATLTLSAASLSLTAAGTAKTVTVTSNTSFSIS
ncbi:MAG: hypothetical protein LBL07_18655 [Tannerella sp.]|nr:hypothetical protein [Tannerella sp.]